MSKYNIKLISGDDSIDIEGYAGAGGTCPRDLQELAARLWGNGAKFKVEAPAVGLFFSDVARA